MSIPAQHAIEKDPTSKQLDDDEWIRSLTEAQEVTIDVPEDRVEYDQQEVDPKKSPRNCSFDDFEAADRSGYSRRRRGFGHLS